MSNPCQAQLIQKYSLYSSGLSWSGWATVQQNEAGEDMQEAVVSGPLMLILNVSSDPTQLQLA